EECDEPTCIAFARDVEHAVRNAAVFWRPSRHVAEERVDRSKTDVATASAVTPVLLQMVQELPNKFRCQVRQDKFRGSLAENLLCKLQQQSEGISIAGDGMRTDLPLLH